jgi:protein tyrosine phosphatase (PTP) superfamily phosphohydrolase (DUF442 family)
MRMLRPAPEPSLAFFGHLRPAHWSPRFLGYGALTGLALFVTASVLRLTAGNNVHVVQTQRVYRAGQMSPARLDEFIRERGIRTVVNLRGYCPDFDWYRDECRVTHDANVSQEDVTLSAIRLPSPSEVRRLLEVIEQAEYPILLHCRQGVDRTGLASVMVKLLEPGVSLAAAERQLGLAFGYVPYNGTENMRRFFDLYRDWLVRLDCGHSPQLFHQWASREYCPGPCRGRLEWVDLPRGQWAANDSRVLKVRAHNDSVESWVLRPGMNHGVHVRYNVYRGDGSSVFAGRAGQFDAAVAPGEAIDLKLGVPPLPPGRYGISADLIAADETAFTQLGGESLIHEFDVGP